MNEMVFLLFLGCVTRLVTSLPLSPSLQMNLPEINEDESNILRPKNAGGTVPVPYILSTKYNSRELNIFAIAMAEYETLTCVRFVPRTTEDDYIAIKRPSGCYNPGIGKRSGSQTVNLNSDCISRGTVQHELNYALGFFHEHMRRDRDSSVEIRLQNVSKESQNNFDKEPTINLGLEYDYNSVINYPRNESTIIPISDPTVPIGQRTGLSILDVSKINKLYSCNVCTTLLSDDKGIFTSPNYPSAYPANVNCVWLIRISSDTKRASLIFSDFDLQSTPKCTSDYVRVYDGPTKNSPVLMDKTCGSQTIPQLIASNNMMLVEFVTDGADAAVGFKASYSSV